MRDEKGGEKMLIDNSSLIIDHCIVRLMQKYVR